MITIDASGRLVSTSRILQSGVKFPITSERAQTYLLFLYFRFSRPLMKIIFVFLFCGLHAFSFGATLPTALSDDTSNKKKPYELDQTEFLARYGRDDSSRALINLFFHKRGIGLPDIAVGIPLLITGGIGLGVINHKAG